MAYFKVLLHGNGVHVKSEDAAIIGFYTTRMVWAGDAALAEKVAAAKVVKEWRSREYADINEGGPPRVHVEEVVPISLFQALFGRFPRKGYTFYLEDD